MTPEIQKEIDSLRQAIKRLEGELLPDHRHLGSDVSKVRLADLETVIFKQATVNPGNLVDGAGETIQVTEVPGATVGDFVLVSAPYDLQDITVTSYVQASGVVEIRLQNETGNTIDLASGVWRILIFKKVV